MKTYRARVRCPSCNALHELATGLGMTGSGPVTRRKPDAGSVTLCIRCGEWAVFETAPSGGLRLRKPTDDEFVEIGEDDLCRRARAAWLQTEKEKQHEPGRTGRRR